MSRTFLTLLFVATGFSLGACGGGDSDSDPAPGPFGDEGSRNEGSSNGVSPGGGSGNPGELTLTAEPGQAIVVADGETIVFRKSESRHYSCNIRESSISINFASDDSRELLINGTMRDGSWAVIAYAEAAGEGAIKYELRVPEGADSFGLGDLALSIEGAASQYDGFRLISDEKVPATFAVNCAEPVE